MNLDKRIHILKNTLLWFFKYRQYILKPSLCLLDILNNSFVSSIILIMLSSLYTTLTRKHILLVKQSVTDWFLFIKQFDSLRTIPVTHRKRNISTGGSRFFRNTLKTLWRRLDVVQYIDLDFTLFLCASNSGLNLFNSTDVLF